MLALLALASISILADSAQAQLLNKLRSICGGGVEEGEVQYSPDDPSTRSRLFNLQTGHAGAFYNCDGEESKRYSPYICWKNGPSDAQLHRPRWDILQWGRDHDEIRQRICDGAGACCSGGICSGGSCDSCNNANVPVVDTATSCGCSECLAATKHTAREKNQLRPRTNAVGLVETKHALNSMRSVVQNPVRYQPVTKQLVAKTKTQPQAQCDCASCRAKQSQTGTPAIATKAPSQQPTAKSRSASLLDRARSSRTQR